MSKIEYAKFQFMVLVLRALFMLIVDRFLDNKTSDDSVWELVNDFSQHITYINLLMEEK